jgi:DNA modification methylase
MIEINKIYYGNCLKWLKEIPDKFIDLTLTDPPYGIGLKYDLYDDTEENWFKLINDVLPELKRVSKMIIMPCCRIARMTWIYANYPPDWLMCWYKGSTGHRSFIGFNDWELHLVYGKRKPDLKMHDYFQTKSSPKKETYGHPCPKPLEWAEWIISRCAMKDKLLVFDPFMGSGTVGVAAKKLGHNFIGVDISKNYCVIAQKRINDVLKQKKEKQ